MADLGSVIIGGALALAGSVGAKYWEEWRQRRALRAAIGAEISSILARAESRGLEKLFRKYVDQWETTQTELPIFVWGYDEMPKDPVFDANVGKIGMLGADVSADVAEFYSLYQAVKVDILAFKKGAFAQYAPPVKVDIFKRSLAIWDDAKRVGERLRKTL